MNDNYNPFDTTRPVIPEVFGHAAYAERKLPDGILRSEERRVGKECRL